MPISLALICYLCICVFDAFIKTACYTVRYLYEVAKHNQNAKNLKDITPLNFPVQEDHLDVVKYLCENDKVSTKETITLKGKQITPYIIAKIKKRTNIILKVSAFEDEEINKFIRITR